MRLQADSFLLATQPVDIRVGADRLTMFVVYGVHPFRDGNGRTARLAMTCVSAAGRRESLCQLSLAKNTSRH
jgi:fido (protein-threonine AMPylation protein)